MDGWFTDYSKLYLVIFSTSLQQSSWWFQDNVDHKIKDPIYISLFMMLWCVLVLNGLELLQRRLFVSLSKKVSTSVLYTPSFADSRGAATYPIERIKRMKFMRSVNMNGIPQRIQKYICFTHPNATVSQFLQNYNMVNAAKDNSCNVYNSHNNQTNNACWLALKLHVNIIQAAMLQHCIIAYCTFQYAYYNSYFE